MKTITGFLFAVFLLLSTASFAQTEKSINDSTTTSQVTRVDTKYFNSLPYVVQKGALPKRVALLSDVTTATTGQVLRVNTLTPTAGNVTITTNDVAENVRLYYTDVRARAALSGAGAIGYNSTTGAFTFTQPAITGDVAIGSGGSTAILATVNSNVGTFGSGVLAVVPTVNAKGLVTGMTTSPITPAGIGAASASTTIPFTPVPAYSGLAGITAPTGNNLVFAIVATDAQYTDTGTLYIIYSSGKIRKVSLLPSEN